MAESLTKLPLEPLGTSQGNKSRQPTSDIPTSDQVCKKCGQVHGLCPAHLVNGQPCRAERNPKNVQRCTNNHHLPGNIERGVSDRRIVNEHRDEINAKRDKHLAHRGLTPDTAPEDALDLCTMAAELSVLSKHRRGNHEKYRRIVADYGSLLKLLDSLYPAVESRVSGLDAEGVSHLPLPVIEARIWELEVQLHPDSGTRPAADILREIVAEAERAAIDIEAIRRAEREAAIRRSAESKHTVPDIPEPPVASTPEPQAATPATPTQRPPTQPLPSRPDTDTPSAVVIEMRKFLNEPRDEPSDTDIKTCLTWSGDWASYESGQLTRAEAVTMTTQWLRSKKGLAR
jgi:hypothetical protein